MEIELDTKYRPGTRTFIYLLLRQSWWILLIALFCLYMAYEMYYGSLNLSTDSFLVSHRDWYISVGMVSEWALLAGISFLLIAYVRTAVLHRAYSFHVDEHALHLRRGLIRVQEITIPYRQISN